MPSTCWVIFPLRRDVHNLDFGLYFCQVKTHSGLAVALSRDVHIEELHKDHNSQIVMEGECVCACVRACMRA